MIPVIFTVSPANYGLLKGHVKNMYTKLPPLLIWAKICSILLKWLMAFEKLLQIPQWVALKCDPVSGPLAFV